NLLFGSDAPVSPMDPWIQMAAAVFRSDDDRAPWRPEQAVDARTALAASTEGGAADPAVILPGHVADLAVVAHDPLQAGRDALREMHVRQPHLPGGRSDAEGGGGGAPAGDGPLREPGRYSARCAKRNQRSCSRPALMPIATSWLVRSVSSSASIAASRSASTASMSEMMPVMTSCDGAKPAGAPVFDTFSATRSTRASIGRPRATMRSAA